MVVNNFNQEKPMKCPICKQLMNRAGITKYRVPKQRYRCTSCKITLTEWADPGSGKRLGDRPLTNVECQQRFKQKNPEAYNAKNREYQRRSRAKKAKLKSDQENT